MRVAGAQPARQPIGLALGHSLTVGHHVELADLAGLDLRFDAESLLDEGGETRRLGLAIASR